jgi:hypothetical protein
MARGARTAAESHSSFDRSLRPDSVRAGERGPPIVGACAIVATGDVTSYTVQISIAFLRLPIGSCPSAGEYSWVTNPVKPRSAMACITKR